MSKEHPGQKLCQTFSIPSNPLGFIFSPENTNRSSFSFASLACFAPLLVGQIWYEQKRKCDSRSYQVKNQHQN